MLREDMLSTLYAKRTSPAEFNFEALRAPSIYNFLSEYDLGKLYDITTSVKYSSKVDKKIKAIKDIMAPRGFVSFSNGTNRMCFRYLEDKSFIVKIPYKISGLDNGYREFKNQQYLKPFVTKTFEVHPSGIASVHERVLPITNKEEYLSVIDDVFAVITALVGKYVLEDIGTKYFMNVGIRSGFGVVFLDYPELFELDGKKLFCNRPIYPNTKYPVCGGLIDYDEGFNALVCTKCGKEYRASELQAAKNNKLILLEGDVNMNVKMVIDGKVVLQSDNVTSTIVRPNKVETRGYDLKPRFRFPVNGETNNHQEQQPMQDEPKHVTPDNIAPVKEEKPVIDEPVASFDPSEAVEKYKAEYGLTDEDVAFAYVSMQQHIPGFSFNMLNEEQIKTLFMNTKGTKDALDAARAKEEQTETNDNVIDEGSPSDAEKGDEESKELPKEKHINKTMSIKSRFIPESTDMSNY